MKTFCLLFAAVSFSLFSCVSAQERHKVSQHIEEIKEDAPAAQDASSMEEEAALVVDAAAGEGAAAVAQGASGQAGRAARPRRSAARGAERSRDAISAEAGGSAAAAGEGAADNLALFSEPLPSLPEALVEATEAEPTEEHLPQPSRVAYLVAGQSLEVWYPGLGWSFEGFRESEESSGMTFSSHRFEDGNTLFFFRSSQPGSYILDFSRFDIPTGRYIADTLSVAIFPQNSLPPNAKQTVVTPGIVRAPDYEGLGTVAAQHSANAQPVAPAIEAEADIAATRREAESDRGGTSVAVAEERQASAAPAFADNIDDDAANETPAMPAPAAWPAASAAPATSSQAESGSPAASSQVSSIEDAQEAQSSAPSQVPPSLSDIRAMIDRGDIDGAILELDRFFAENAGGSDEALFLQGQAYEADSPRRDMRRALSAYETLVQAYPISRFWQDADRRIRYIRRFYIDMR